MGERGELVVLRVGHRPGRDDRITTHVGLAARALGADRFVLASEHAGPLDRIDDVTDRFGGPFATEQTDGHGQFLSDWDGRVVHLTMYGLPIQEYIGEVRESVDETGLVVVIGAEKVPFEVYERADWNLAVTNQPHSEVAGLAVFLDRYTDGEALEPALSGGTHRVVPQARGKRVEGDEDIA